MLRKEHARYKLIFVFGIKDNTGPVYFVSRVCDTSFSVLLPKSRGFLYKQISFKIFFLLSSPEFRANLQFRCILG